MKFQSKIEETLFVSEIFPERRYMFNQDLKTGLSIIWNTGKQASFMIDNNKNLLNSTIMKNKQIATFGGGCFLCLEAVVQRLKGIASVVSGYTAGHVKDPSYREICGGMTGHAEVVQVTFDADVISYEDLITIFMTSHDPTTLNRQGADRGTQYRSIIVYHDDLQREIAERVVAKLADTFPDTIVTEVVALDLFYPAEKYHQNYYNENSFAGYCRVVIDPKIKKLSNVYADRMKTEV